MLAAISRKPAFQYYATGGQSWKGCRPRLFTGNSVPHIRCDPDSDESKIRGYRHASRPDSFCDLDEDQCSPKEAA